MIRHIASLTLGTLLISGFIACDKPGATEKQREDKATEQAGEARNEANQNVENAQAKADKDIAAARTDFERTREDYRHSRTTDLTRLDKKIADLDAKARTATGKTKADLDAHLPAIRQQRDDFVRDMVALDRTSPDTWDQAKSNLDKEWDSLESSVDKAY
jgi:vacuolar-type H+-ATPase subunit H